jgi:Ras-related protein Rab-1A
MVDIRFAKENVLRVLVGNKCDLDHKRQVSYEQGKDLARQYNIQFMETSAKESLNIEELFISSAKLFIEKQGPKEANNKKDKNVKGNTISIDNLNNPTQHRDDTCC